MATTFTLVVANIVDSHDFRLIGDFVDCCCLLVVAEGQVRRRVIRLRLESNNMSLEPARACLCGYNEVPNSL